METTEIKGGVLEYIDETHTYLYDGVVLPSITQLLKVKFGNKYNGIPKATLERAAEQGTAVHKAIEDYERDGIESDLPELRNYKFLKKAYNFECVSNEVPVVLGILRPQQVPNAARKAALDIRPGHELRGHAQGVPAGEGGEAGPYAVLGVS